MQCVSSHLWTYLIKRLFTDTPAPAPFLHL